MRLVLASASPRRKLLLEQIGMAPDEVRPATINECRIAGEKPREYCRRMAREKALAIDILDGEVVLAADTVAILGTRILGKPADEAEAAEFLRNLSGRRHRVITAIAARNFRTLRERDVVSIVKMKRLSSAEIALYLQSGEWRGKAGGYGIQGLAGMFIPWISGTFAAVSGLPLVETAGLLQSFGIGHKDREC